MRNFTISISTDDEDAVEIIREATRKIACELGWSDHSTTSIEATEDFFVGAPDYLAGYELEPGQDEELTCDTCGRVGNREDAIEPGGPCQEPCDGIVRRVSEPADVDFIAFPDLAYHHTHYSVRDGSPAMLLSVEDDGALRLVNEDGIEWAGSPSEWVDEDKFFAGYTPQPCPSDCGHQGVDCNH